MTYQEYEKRVEREMNKMKFKARMDKIAGLVLVILISILVVVSLVGNYVNYFG